MDKAQMTTVPCQEEQKVAWESVGIRNQDGELREQRELSRQCSVWLLHAGAPVRLRHLVVFIAERVFNMQGVELRTQLFCLRKSVVGSTDPVWHKGFSLALN